MADIRCLPGMEGSPVFGEKSEIVGMLTRPLRQRGSGAEVQLVIPWEAIVTTFGSNTINMMNKDPPKHVIHDHIPNEVEKAMSSVCLITVGDGVWASGVVLNNQGLILTNAHLLEPWRFKKTTDNNNNNYKAVSNFFCTNQSGDKNNNHQNIRVRVGYLERWIWSDASVVYVSKGSLDVALLRLDFVPRQHQSLRPIKMDLTCPSLGSKVYVIGHGLFGPRSDSLPSACIGVVAKVVKAQRFVGGKGDFPAMIETTAAVHPGGSGGAIINSNGHMISLVTSNARHGGGTVIPHLNFSIPCAALDPIINFSKDMKDISILEDLDKPNEQLSSVWALMPPVSPKPMPRGDNINDTKGSRFAKFIAERQQWLPPGNKDPHSSKLLPTKL